MLDCEGVLSARESLLLCMNAVFLCVCGSPCAPREQLLLLAAALAAASHMPSDCAGYSTGQSYARHPLLCTGEHLGFRSLFLPEMAIKTCVLSHATPFSCETSRRLRYADLILIVP